MSFLKLTPSKFMKIKTTGQSERKKLEVYNKIEQLLWDFYTFERTKDRRITKRNVPFIIGINGSVSSGKSFFAKLRFISLTTSYFTPNLVTISFKSSTD